MAHCEFVGVDGCRGGWLGVRLSGSEEYEVENFSTFEGLIAHYGTARLILVDMPIGLPECQGGRDCDREARKLLGNKRGPSVFPTPTRQTVRQAAKAPEDEPAAQATELHHAKKGISKQTFAIACKIDEVDKVMQSPDRGATQQVREFHPEVCFWALNGGKAMAFRKGKVGGTQERLRVLEELEPRTKEILKLGCSKFLRKCVAQEDIVDALVAAVTARGGEGHLLTLPANPCRDPKGLLMEMVFWKP